MENLQMINSWLELYEDLLCLQLNSAKLNFIFNVINRFNKKIINFLEN